MKPALGSFQRLSRNLAYVAARGARCRKSLPRVFATSLANRLVPRRASSARAVGSRRASASADGATRTAS